MMIASVLFLILILGFSGISRIFDQDKVSGVRELSGVATAFWAAFVSLLGLIAVRSLMRREIAGMGLSTAQLALELDQKAGLNVRKVGAFKPINRTRGILAASAGAFILLLNFLPDPSNVHVAEFFMRLNRTIQLLGFFLLVKARRYFQPDADSVLHLDQRSPILFSAPSMTTKSRPMGTVIRLSLTSLSKPASRIISRVLAPLLQSDHPRKPSRNLVPPAFFCQMTNGRTGCSTGCAAPRPS